ATPSNRGGSMTGDTERQEAVTPERDEPSPHAQEEQSLRTRAPQPDGPPPRPLAVVIPGWGHGCLPAPALQGIGTERGQVMPEAWNKKRERQYQHVKDSAEGRGESEDTAEEIAARTVNKARAQQGESEEA